MFRGAFHLMGALHWIWWFLFCKWNASAVPLPRTFSGGLQVCFDL